MSVIIPYAYAMLSMFLLDIFALYLKRIFLQIFSYHSFWWFSARLWTERFFFVNKGKRINSVTFCWNVSICHNFLAVIRPAPIAPKTGYDEILLAICDDYLHYVKQDFGYYSMFVLLVSRQYVKLGLQNVNERQP